MSLLLAAVDATAPSSTSSDVRVAIVGAAAIVVGAAFTAGFGVLALALQQRHQQTQNRHALKRATYESFLDFVLGFNIDTTLAATSGTAPIEVVAKYRDGFIKRAIGMRLDASPDVRARVKEVEAALERWIDEIRPLPAGPTYEADKLKLFHNIVHPAVDRATDAMAAELKSR